MNLLENNRFRFLPLEAKALLFAIWLRCQRHGFAKIRYEQMVSDMWGISAMAADADHGRIIHESLALLEGHHLLISEGDWYSVPGIIPQDLSVAVVRLCGAKRKAFAAEVLGEMRKREGITEALPRETRDEIGWLLASTPPMVRVKLLPEPRHEEPEIGIRIMCVKGEWWCPTNKMIDKWQDEYPETRIVDVLQDMERLVNTGKYGPYKKRGMRRRAGQWIDRDATQLHKHTRRHSAPRRKTRESDYGI